MKRALVVLGLVLPAMPPAGTAALARTQVAASPKVEPRAPELLVTPTLLVSRLASALDLPALPHGLVDQLVRWRCGLRDLVHRTSDQLATVAQRAGFTIPDLTVLTTQPVATSDTAWATSGFGWREDPLRHRRKFHRGADVRARSGTPVVAAGDGVVVFAGRQGGYGNVLYVDHGGGVVTRYAHLRRIEAKLGAALVGGQRIGQVGATGRATGPHLHFEVRLDGRAVDPGTAMTVAELEREAPAAGRLAAFALTPEMQALAESDLDPPRTRRAKAKAPKGARPDRPGHRKRARPVS